MNHEQKRQFLAGVRQAMTSYGSYALFIEPSVFRVRGRVWGASYSGCEGWAEWPIDDFELVGTMAHIEAEKKRIESEQREKAPTYTRRDVVWSKPEIVE